jgi:preprotein translocase subunit YajC
MSNLWMLAQSSPNEVYGSERSTPVTDNETEASTKVDSDPNKVDKTTSGSGSPWLNFLPFVLIMVFMYVILLRGPRKKQQQHKQMVQTLQKNDKVRTIGGIVGTVVDIKGDEITLKVDESNNTKIKVISSAIGRNLSKDND